MKRFNTLLVAFSVISMLSFAQSTKRVAVDYNAATTPAWSKIEQWKASATNPIQFFPADTTRAKFTLFRADFDINSTLAAFAFNSGGMIVDGGWLRVLGSGCDKFNRGLIEWNKGKTVAGSDTVKYFLVADDVVGGFFALYLTPHTRFENALVYYQGPNDRRWVSTGLHYDNFLQFCFAGEIKMFYNNYRWEGWKKEIHMINTNQTISCYPEFWTEGARDTKLKRRVVPVQKLWDLYNPKVEGRSTSVK